jgi:hypothetical protein
VLLGYDYAVEIPETTASHLLGKSIGLPLAGQYFCPSA